MATNPTIDKALDALKVATIGALVSNAAEAYVAGQTKAAVQLRLPLSFNLVSSRAMSATKTYKEQLLRFGGSDVTEVVNGVPKRVFKPWLKDSIEKDRETIGQIIQDSIQNGTPKRDIIKALDQVFINREHNSALVAHQEVKMQYVRGTFDRYDEEQVQRAEWVHLDQESPRVEHEERDGKIYDLDDPIWEELYLPNCHCSARPILGREVEV